MKDLQHRKEIMANLRTLKPEELVAQEQQRTEELFQLGFKVRSGQLDNIGHFRKAKKMLARVKTVLNGTRKDTVEGPKK